MLSGLTGDNGVFAAGTPGAFPTATYNSTNYWVDVTFAPRPRQRTGHHLARGASASPRTRRSPARSPPPTPTATPLTYAIAGGADAGALHHRRHDRRAPLPHRAQLRGPGRRRRQQRLQPDGQRLRRHLAAVERAVAVTVTDVVENRARPTAAIVAPATNEDAAAVQINLLAGASDPDGDALVVVSAGHGHLVERVPHRRLHARRGAGSSPSIPPVRRPRRGPVRDRDGRLHDQRRRSNPARRQHRDDRRRGPRRGR